MTVQVLPPGTPIDLTNCDREPIHIPGAIQPHGVLLALTEPDLMVAQASDNVGDHLGAAGEPDWHTQLIGQKLDALVDPASATAVRKAISGNDPRLSSPVWITAREDRGGRSFEGILHRTGGLLVLELEPADPSSQISFSDFYFRVRGAVTRLQGASRVVEMCQLATDEVAAMTGFDRVMAYRFDEDDHGHVIAETKRADLESFLDLHYPASDIPAQARRLYTVNWLRLIADVGYRPSAVRPTDNPLTGQPLDLSFSVLRSVSPIHLEYLSNMGIRASMSVSLVVDGHLWGLIICHHYSPRFVPYNVRTSAEFMGQVLSWQVAARERADDFERRAVAQARLARLIDRLANASDLASALTEEASVLLGAVDAGGAAVRLGERWLRVGDAPEEGDLDQMATELERRMSSSTAPRSELFPGGVIAIDCFAKAFPEARHHDRIASGVLATALTPDHRDWLIWFRPEVVQLVNWAGDPNKLASLADGANRLSPRGSFALWKETVKQRALPWEKWQVEVATGLQRAFVGRVFRKNEELTHLNLSLESKVAERTEELIRARDDLAHHAEDLERSNTELERFAYVASHDLQEPLRMVVSYVQLLQRRYTSKLDSDADEFIGYAVDGAKRMQSLINDLLAYSRAGRPGRPYLLVDLESVLTTVLNNLSIACEESGATITHDPLPKVNGDPGELCQLMQNLISNALKFRRDGAPPKVHLSARRESGFWTLGVHDQGIGISPDHIGKIFIIFKRLHTRAEFPGSGIGLAIGKKIVERHGGRLWVESVPKVGSTFFFTLPDPFAGSSSDPLSTDPSNQGTSS